MMPMYISASDTGIMISLLLPSLVLIGQPRRKEQGGSEVLKLYSSVITSLYLDRYKHHYQVHSPHIWRSALLWNISLPLLARQSPVGEDKTSLPRMSNRSCEKNAEGCKSIPAAQLY